MKQTTNRTRHHFLSIAIGLFLSSILLPGCGSSPDKSPDQPPVITFDSISDARTALRGPQALSAIAWLEIQAQSADSPVREEALIHLARIYAKGEQVAKDETRAASYFFEAARIGNTDAQAEMAHRFHHGLGVPRNLGQSVLWARKAAENGNAEGQLFLGWAYEHGAGLQKNYMRAARLYENASAQGNAAAMYHLGTLHHRGRLNGINNDRAVTLYRRSADMGYGPAHLALGFVHLFGDGLAKDREKALKWFLKASDRDVAEGAFQAAKLLEGRGHQVAARELYRRAYRLGKVSAMLDVRRLDGRPVTKDIQIGG